MPLNSIWGSIKSEVEFLNQYPTLLQATSDNDSPISGYLLGEITDLTYVNDGEHCMQLTKFLISRLQSDSEAAKFKALKVLLHIVKNGHINMIETIKAHEIHLKEVTGTVKSSHDYSAREDYSARDNKAMLKELLFLVFSESFQLERSEEAGSRISEVPIGYGAQASTNKLQGFGNISNVSKSMGDRVTEGFTNFVDKILSPSNEDDFYKKQASILSESLPQYKPVTIEKSNDDCIAELPKEISANKSTSSSRFKKPVHVAGRAGGGWDDSDTEVEQETVISLDDSADLSLSMDSPENKKDIMTPLDYAEERHVVDEFLMDLPLENIKYKEIDTLCKRCLSLNCDKILETLVERLNCDKENIKLRCLVFMEYLLQQDIVHTESFLKIAVPNLKQLSQMPKSSVQIKAKKICLILDCINKSAKSPQAHQISCTPVNVCKA